MKTLLKFILSNIVEDKKNLKIEETVEEGGSAGVFLHLSATVGDSDVGRVIGKGGRTIRAIRQLLKIRAIRDQSHVRFDLTNQ